MGAGQAKEMKYFIFSWLIESLCCSNEITDIGTHSNSTYKLPIKIIFKNYQ